MIRTSGAPRWLVLVGVACVAVAAFWLVSRRPKASTRQPGRIEALVDRLRSTDPEAVEKAAEELQRLAEAGLADDEPAFLLRAATGSFPERKSSLSSSGSTPGDLVRAAVERPSAELVPVVVEVFPQLPPPARKEALSLLMRFDDAAVAGTVLRLLREERARGEATTAFRTAALQHEPAQADVYFPALLEFTDGPNLFEVCLALFAARDAGLLRPGQLSPQAPRVLDAWRSASERVRAAQARARPGWLWQEDYQEVREEAGLLLDLLALLPIEAVRGELRSALELRDPKLEYFAALSLLRLGEEVPAGVFDDVAASAETRGWLFDALSGLGKGALFPTRWRNAKSFAESEMVVWLAYPTELGRPPDELELMRIVSEELPGQGFFDWYLFRFRTHEPHWAAKDGWMGGVAGPFKRSDGPSPKSYGDTFSTFEKWDAASPAEHVRSVRELIEKAKQRQAGR